MWLLIKATYIIFVRRQAMNDYTLNDINFNPQEVSLFVKDDNYMPDKKAIEKEFEKNRELFNRFKEECKDILSAQLSKPKA